MNTINEKGNNTPGLYGQSFDIEDVLAELYFLIWKYAALGMNCQEDNSDDKNKPTDAWKHISCRSVENFKLLLVPKMKKLKQTPPWVSAGIGSFGSSQGVNLIGSLIKLESSPMSPTAFLLLLPSSPRESDGDNGSATGEVC